MEPWELGAREAIRETLARYAHLVDRGRLDETAALFTEDGVLEAGDEPAARGREAIRALFAGAGTRLAAGGRARIRHHVSSVTIAFDDAWTATSDSYFLAVTERGPDHWGRYRDRLVLRDGQWLFAHRRVRVDGRAP
ncbi:MAG TPA: nuclear transport factor 2 family protein [Candidatus Binatia bacterium]|nr:nuclear transport factor 2 family protein [Candidatus Binatia bacterium]